MTKNPCPEHPEVPMLYCLECVESISKQDLERFRESLVEAIEKEPWDELEDLVNLIQTHTPNHKED